MYVIDAPTTPSLAVAGSTDRFPVRRIFCVGRNYEDHVIEMGNDTREPPFFFTKPADAARDTPCHMPYPPLTENLHFEILSFLLISPKNSLGENNSHSC